MGNKKKCSKNIQPNIVERNKLSSRNEKVRSSSSPEKSKDKKLSNEKMVTKPTKSKNKGIQCKPIPETSWLSADNDPSHVYLPSSGYSLHEDTNNAAAPTSLHGTFQNASLGFRSSSMEPFCSHPKSHRDLSVPCLQFKTRNWSENLKQNPSDPCMTYTSNLQYNNSECGTTLFSPDEQYSSKGFMFAQMSRETQSFPQITKKATNCESEFCNNSKTCKPFPEVIGGGQERSYVVIDIPDSQEQLSHYVNNNQFFDSMGDQCNQNQITDPRAFSVNRTHGDYLVMPHQYYPNVPMYCPQTYFYNRSNAMKYLAPPITVDKSVQTDESHFNYEDHGKKTSTTTSPLPVGFSKESVELTKPKYSATSERERKFFRHKSTSTDNLESANGVNLFKRTKDSEIQTSDKNLVCNHKQEAATQNFCEERSSQQTHPKEFLKNSNQQLYNRAENNVSAEGDSSKDNHGNNFNQICRLFEALWSKNVSESKPCNTTETCKCGHPFADHCLKSRNSFAKTANQQSPKSFCGKSKIRFNCTCNNDDHFSDSKCPISNENNCPPMPNFPCHECCKNIYKKVKYPQERFLNEYVHDDDDEICGSRNARNKPRCPTFTDHIDSCCQNVNCMVETKLYRIPRNRRWCSPRGIYTKCKIHPNIPKDVENYPLKLKTREHMYENVYSREPSPVDKREANKRDRLIAHTHDVYHDKFGECRDPHLKQYMDYHDQDFINPTHDLQPLYNGISGSREMHYDYSSPVDYQTNERQHRSEIPITTNYFQDKRGNYLDKQSYYYRLRQQRDDGNRRNRERTLRKGYIGKENRYQPQAYGEYAAPTRHYRPSYRGRRGHDSQIQYQGTHYRQNHQFSCNNSPKRNVDNRYSTSDAPSASMSNKHASDRYSPSPVDNRGYRPRVSPFTSRLQQYDDCNDSRMINRHCEDFSEYEQSPSEYNDTPPAHSSKYTNAEVYHDTLPSPSHQYEPHRSHAHHNVPEDHSFPLPPPPLPPNPGRNASRPSVEKVLKHKPFRNDEFNSVMDELRDSLMAKGKWNGEHSRDNVG